MNNATRYTVWLIIAVSIVVGLLACSFDSLWIDEAWMAKLASEESLAGWWHRLREISGSTLQMPLYTLYLWLWEKLAGHSEWALRAANIPFFVLGQWALFRGFSGNRRLGLWVTLIAAVNPFLWSYLAEARPYLMQYGGACLVVAGLVQLAERRPFAGRDLLFFCCGLGILCASSALAFPWAGMALIAALVCYRKDRALVPLVPGNLVLLAGTGLFLLVILAYDFWAASNGAKATQIGTTNYRNLLFAGYELLGFTGLGPGRLQLRESQSFSVFAPYFLPLTSLALALAIAPFFWRRVSRPLWGALVLYSTIPLIFLTLLGVIAPFRLLGRHFTPIIPVLLVLLTYAAASPAKWWLNRVFIVVWLVSALLLRTQPRHRRDDYRGAAAQAREALARGEVVWWSADAAGAEYYKVPLREQGAATSNSAVLTAHRVDFSATSSPDTVILSRADVYDPSGGLREFLSAHHYEIVQHLPAFAIWKNRSPRQDNL